MGFPSHLVATEYTLPIRNSTPDCPLCTVTFCQKAALASILAYPYILSFILARRYAGVGFAFVKFLQIIRVLELESRVFGMRDEVRCRRIPFLDSRVGRAFLELNLGWIYLGSISEPYPNVLVPWPTFSRGLPNVAFDHLEIRQSLVQKGLCNVLRSIPAGPGLVTPYLACHLDCNLKVFLAISHHCRAFRSSSHQLLSLLGIVTERFFTSPSLLPMKPFPLLSLWI